MADPFIHRRYLLFREIRRNDAEAIYNAIDTDIRFPNTQVFILEHQNVLSPEQKKEAIAGLLAEAKTWPIHKKQGREVEPQIIDDFVEGGKHYLVALFSSASGENKATIQKCFCFF